MNTRHDRKSSRLRLKLEASPATLGCACLAALLVMMAGCQRKPPVADTGAADEGAAASSNAESQAGVAPADDRPRDADSAASPSAGVRSDALQSGAEASSPAQVTQPKPPSDWAATDLLRMFNVREHTTRGGASLSAAGLKFTNPAGACQVFFPRYDPPEEYDLQAEIVRAEGEGAVILGLYAWGKQCRVVLDADVESGKRSGLAPLAGKWVNQPGYPGGHDGPVLRTGEASQVLCRVRRDGLEVICDGQTIINHQGSATELASSLGKLRFYHVPSERALSIASWKCKASIPRLTLYAPPSPQALANNGNATEASSGSPQASSNSTPTSSATEPPTTEPRTTEPPTTEPRTAEPPPKLPLEPADWAFAFRQVPNTRVAVSDPSLSMKKTEQGLRAVVGLHNVPTHVVYRPRLDGDFRGTLQILVPSINDPDSYQPGGTAVPYIGFRPAGQDGREITFSVPRAAAEPTFHQLQFEREGTQLRMGFGAQAPKTVTVLPTQAFHLFVHVNGPGKIFIVGHHVEGSIGPSDFAEPQLTPLPAIADDWALLRPAKKTEDGLGPVEAAQLSLKESDGSHELYITNSLNEPLLAVLARPLRGDFHFVAHVDVVSRSLDRRTRGATIDTTVDVGWAEVNAMGESKTQDFRTFALKRPSDATEVRLDIVREAGQITAYCNGSSIGRMPNAADGLLGFRLQVAGEIVIRNLGLHADRLLDTPPALAAGTVKTDNREPAEVAASSPEVADRVAVSPSLDGASPEGSERVEFQNQPPRMWTDANDKYRVRAILQSLKVSGGEEVVTLQLEDEQLVDVPLRQLSPADRSNVATAKAQQE